MMAGFCDFRFMRYVRRAIPNFEGGGGMFSILLTSGQMMNSDHVTDGPLLLYTLELRG